jgi:hypothetical protein
MHKRNPSLHPAVRREFHVPDTMSDADFLRHWKQAANRVCKPCWELRYCPYGPLVEDFPLPPLLRSAAESHNVYLRECLATGKLGNGRRLDPKRRKAFEQELAEYDPEQYPESIPPEISRMGCTVFGHICPVMFVSEGFTETSAQRRRGRYISFKVKIRVVRRDNYTCQHCGRHLQDNEVEFDHIIPLARGGSSDEHNIRLTCHDCNQDKSDRVDI